MKYIVNESKFKEFLRNKFNFDLTGKIQMITNRYQVPSSFDSILPSDKVNYLLNNHGPMYLITMNKDSVYIYQSHINGDDHLMFDEDGWLTDREFMNMWGIGKLGIPLNKLIDIYFEEGEE
jgi:hypothetical protein